MDTAVARLQRVLDRPEMPWRLKCEFRDRQSWTPSERKMWHALEDRFPFERRRPQWWVRGTNYRVDFLIEPERLVLEVDGSSHRGREVEDRVRSMALRLVGCTIARVRVEDVNADADRIAAVLAFRTGADRVVEFAEAVPA